MIQECLQWEYCALQFNNDVEPPLYIGARFLMQPRAVAREESQCKQQIENLNIGTVINVSDNHAARDNHRRLYDEMHIEFHELPIADAVEDIKEFHRFLNRCVECYGARRDRSRSVFIHCSLGINRSAAAAAAILWAHHSGGGSETPEQLVAHMRTQQTEQRRLKLLHNDLMEMATLEWCKKSK